VKRIDLVVAVRDEEEAIPLFVDEVRRLRLPVGSDLSMLFVEDSSRDGTRGVLRRLAGKHSGVAYYAVKNDFGQGPAIVFGVARSTGDAVITMDVDGTHPVSAIPVMVERFLQGHDIVQCVRKTPPEREAYRNLGATAFHFLARLVTGLDTREQNIYFRLMSANAASELLNHPRYWHFLRLPLPRTPGRFSFLEVDTVERSVGRSKYNPVRLAKVAVDAVLSLLPRTRMIVWTGIALILAWFLSLLGSPRLALGMILIQATLVLRYLSLEKPDLLNRMTILEYADQAQVRVERPAV
jgi:glycosyltransferase involved in cell wall biosynthesis